jgi:prepilin signal peptidase PulO-like enzyme (type II secretory pathway)
MQAGTQELTMRRKLRKTLPFLLAICLGTIAAALVAGMALLAAPS